MEIEVPFLLFVLKILNLTLYRNIYIYIYIYERERVATSASIEKRFESSTFNLWAQNMSGKVVRRFVSFKNYQMFIYIYLSEDLRKTAHFEFDFFFL